MRQCKTAMFAVASSFVISGCTTNAVGVTPTVTVAAPGVLQFAVGTATLATSSGGSVVALNVVTTFRKSGGASATLSNTPTLTGPAGTNLLALPGGQGIPSLTGLRLDKLLADASNPMPGMIESAPLGSLVGVFGYGFAPLNLTPVAQNVVLYPNGSCDGVIFTSGTIGSGYPFDTVRYDALPLPLFGSRQSCNGAPAFGLGLGGTFPPLGVYPPGSDVSPASVDAQFYGGPPAWPSPQRGNLPAGFKGYPAGFTDVLTAPVPGTYSLDVAYATSADGTQYGHATQSATMSAAAVGQPLAPVPQPMLQVQSDGSAFATVTVPAGISEEIVFISTDQCNGSGQQEYYSLLLRTQGAQQRVFIPSTLGAPDMSGKPTHTFCTIADVPAQSGGTYRYSATAVGFDYPAWEASYPQTTTATPVIANASGQADISVSSPASGSYKAH